MSLTSTDISDLDVLPGADLSALADLAGIGLVTCGPLTCGVFSCQGYTHTGSTIVD